MGEHSGYFMKYFSCVDFFFFAFPGFELRFNKHFCLVVCFNFFFVFEFAFKLWRMFDIFATTICVFINGVMILMYSFVNFYPTGDFQAVIPFEIEAFVRFFYFPGGYFVVADLIGLKSSLWFSGCHLDSLRLVNSVM